MQSVLFWACFGLCLLGVYSYLRSAYFQFSYTMNMNAAEVTLPHQSICATCLSQDRKLFHVNDSKSHALFLLNLSEGDKLCWECHFFVRKVAAFQSRAARAQALLAGALLQTGETKINSLSSLVMIPVYLEISLGTPDLSLVNIKTETTKEGYENTSYECPVEDAYDSDDVPRNESYEESDEESLLPVSNKQTEARCDKGACVENEMDDVITNASSQLKSEEDLLDKKLEPGREADATPEFSQVRAGHGPARSQTLEQQVQLRSGFVGLERIPLGNEQTSSFTIPVTFDCNLKRQHDNQQATPHGDHVHASAEQSRLGTSNKPTWLRHLSKKHTNGKVFSCDTCHKRFTRKSSLITHLRVHTGEKPFSCDTCDKRFRHKSSLTAHLVRHTAKKTFSCDVCDIQFRHKKAMTVHLRIHTSEKPFSCDICHKQFTLKSNMIQHLNLHTDEKPFCCDICGKRFNYLSNFKCHLRIHTGERPFGCDKCGKRFKQITALRTHLQTHTGKKPFFCDICNKGFGLKYYLIKHIRSHSKPFRFDICKKQFKDKSTLLPRLEVHTGEKFSCDICQKLLMSKQSVNTHKRLVHTLAGVKSFCCDICPKQYKRKCELAAHLRIHTGERPYGCDVCGKRFKEGSTLKGHLRIHTGEKPFSCEICGKRFNHNSAMKSHLRTHTNEKPFGCETCGRRFNHKVGLKNHLRTHP